MLSGPTMLMIEAVSDAWSRPTHPPTYLPTYLHTCSSSFESARPALSSYLPTYLPTDLPTYQPEIPMLSGPTVLMIGAVSGLVLLKDEMMHGRGGVVPSGL